MRKCVLRVVEGGCHEKNCRKRILSRRKSKAQGPEAGKGVVCWRRKRPVWPAPEWARWGNKYVGDDTGGVGGDQILCLV